MKFAHVVIDRDVLESLTGEARARMVLFIALVEFKQEQGMPVDLEETYGEAWRLLDIWKRHEENRALKEREGACLH